MAVVTGDRYLDLLVRFVDRQAGPLLDGALTLRLNPTGLRYVQSRLEALRELESLLAGAPVDYLRAYVSDLGDHRALEQLRRFLALLTALKVVSVLPSPARDPTPLSLLPFARLRVLELRGCDLSTSPARGLLELRGTLERLVCHNSTDALRHVFASRIADIKESLAWTRLSFVSCACNGLVLMDESLQLLPVVETLDLSRNRFAKVDNLRKCTKLKNLDLGFNHLRTIASLSEVSCPIVKLVLRNNCLTTLRGIENLKLVQGLDISYNIISSFSELEILSSLSCLESIWLEGNPICCARWYRAYVFSFSRHPEKLKLDDKVISTREYWEMQIILASRQKRPAGYGFYFPAKDHIEDDNNIIVQKKKNSRLAYIEEGRRKYFCSDDADQESLSCDSNNLEKDESAVSRGESEAVGLMNRVEFMKKEQSVLWLREFKEWMDQPSVSTTNGGESIDLFSGATGNNYEKHVKTQRNLDEVTRYAHNMVQVSDGESSSNVLDSDVSFADTYTGGNYNEYFGINGKMFLEPPMVNESHIVRNDFRPVGMSAGQDDFNFGLRGPLNLFPLELKGSSHYNSSIVEEGSLSGGKVILSPLTTIDKIMGSRSSSTYPGSPPQYRQDILNRRLNLEEEFLQVSAESHSVASSDSDSSCSDDDLCKHYTSLSELDHLPCQQHTSTSINDPLGVCHYEGKHHDGAHEEARSEDNICSSASCDESDPNNGKCLLPNNGNLFSEKNILDDVDACHFGQNEIQHVANIDKRKGLWKIKRRLISLSGCSMEVENPEVDVILEVEKDDMDLQRELLCNENRDHLCDDSSVLCFRNCEVVKSPAIVGHGSRLKTKQQSLVSNRYEFIKNFFEVKIADSRGNETCEELVFCDCIFQVGSVIKENEVAVLLSNKNMLYILLIEAAPDGQGAVVEPFACHSLDDIREVVTGLGLHVLRVNMDGSTTYLFLTRNIEKSRDLLHLLRVCDSIAFHYRHSLRSWEQVQIKFLEKHICGKLKMSIFLYSMLLFWQNKCGGESWHSRSLFVIEGYMLVCIENLVQFGSFTDDTDSSPPYYTIDSCCAVRNILEAVIELGDCRCLTLTMDHATSGSISLDDEILSENQSEACTWKLKWYSEDTMLKFVSLIKALHAELTTSPLHVKCISA